MSVALGGRVEVHASLGPRQPAEITGKIQIAARLRPRHRGTRWKIVAVTMGGNVVHNGWLDRAVLDPSMPFEVGKPESFSFRMHASDPKAALFAYGDGDSTPYQEVQVWYGDRCVAWGPAVSPDWADDGTVTVQCKGALWYPLERRFVGPAERQNMLRNGIFWSMQYWQQLVADNDTHTFVAQDTDTNIANQVHPTLTNYGSVRIEDRSDPEPDGHKLPYIAQDVRFNASHKAITVTLRARVRVEAFDGPNIRRTGLVMVLLPVGYTNVWEDGLDFKTGDSIDENTPTGEIIDMSCSLEIPWSGNDRIVQARIEGCKGVINVTDVWMEYTDSLRLFGDQAFVFTALMDHLTGNVNAPWPYSIAHPNSPWTQAGGYGKSDVLISVDAPDTGVDIYRDYQFRERNQGGSSVAELANRDNGIECSIRYTQSTRQVFIGFPKIGRLRRDCRLTNIKGRGNVISWPYQWLGEQGSTSVTVTPPANAWREGSAIDTTAFGGLTLEENMAAPVEVDRDNLDAVASRRMVATIKPAAMTVITSKELWADRGLRVGDRTEVLFARGDMTIDGTWWIRRLDPMPGTKFLALDIVPWPY